MKKIFMSVMIMMLAALLMLSSCTTPNNPNEENTSGKATLTGEVTTAMGNEEATSGIEEITTSKPMVEPEYIKSDLNADGIAENIIIDTSVSPATLQIVQKNGDQTLTLAEYTLGDSDFGGYYLIKQRNYYLLSWSYFIDDYFYAHTDPFPHLFFQYKLYSFATKGEIMNVKQGGSMFPLDNERNAHSGELDFLDVQQELNQLLPFSLDEGYVLMENRGNGVVCSTVDHLIRAESIHYDLSDIYYEMLEEEK